LGHFNPETARRTEEKSLRSIFGRDRERNCVMQIFNLSNRYLDLKFWFGGRVQKGEWEIAFEEKEKPVVSFM
jgi:hypothetical protein